MSLSRRTLFAAAAVAAMGATQPTRASAAVPQPVIEPRASWGAQAPVRGRLLPEDDVRFLLVHHTLTPNNLQPGGVPTLLRSIHRFHTGAEKGWPDVAYNFFVDPFGQIWEGREGSLAGPVQADATGGSQGCAQLVCFLGDFTTVLPTPEALDAAVRLLAWLASRHELTLAGPVEFVSRGSTKWRKGAVVTTDQIAGHRDMSVTECPGEALYPLVRSVLLPQAHALLNPPATTATVAVTTSATAAPAPAAKQGRGRTEELLVIGGGLALGAASAAAGLAVRQARSEHLKRDPHPADGERRKEAD